MEEAFQAGRHFHAVMLSRSFRKTSWDTNAHESGSAMMFYDAFIAARRFDCEGRSAKGLQEDNQH